jgi:hypothetical protein
LSAELPPGVHETVECLFGVKNENYTELLHSHTESGLELEHLHEGFFLALVVDCDAFSIARASDQNFHAQVAEDRVSGRAFSGPTAVFAVQTDGSGQYRYVKGKLQRNRERITVRGLNDNHN